MHRASSPEELREHPVGAYLAGRSWAHGCLREDVFFVLLWGRPNEDDVRALMRSLVVELSPPIAPHVSLVDASHLDGADAASFGLLNDYVRGHHGQLGTAVTRLALVRPGGMAGAIVAGFYQVLDPPYPVAVFDSAEPALTWLDAARAPQLLKEVSAVHGELLGIDPLVGSLRALLATRLATVDLAIAARSLGLSERTLQRRLHEAGTTFANELSNVRLAEAQRRMLDTDASLTAIALDVGFASLQHFSAIFRRVTGEPPSAWRERHAQNPPS